MFGIAGRGKRAHAHAGSQSQAELIREYENGEPNSLQLARLADLAGVPVAQVEGKSIATLKDELLIDPALFRYELVCGQVVKVDPVTGLKYPVAGATVTVNDLECDWLWFFPPGWPWSWGFRWPRCVSVPIKSVQSGPCGEFCLLIPRWDIEWIRRWITERWCFPEILSRPTVADLLAPHLPGGVAVSAPDPAALAGLLDTREDLAAAIGPAAVQAIRDASRTQSVGALTTGLSDVLAANAFTRPVPAPVPAELRALSPAQAKESFSARLGLRPTEGELDLSLPFGPFLRCVDVEVPSWLPIYSVPDINFVVTQQVGGTEEVIYDGAFDADWDTWPAPLQVELDVSQSAVASPVPGCSPQGIECQDEPAIISIGLLDVAPADGYLDPGGSGFAVLMNKPNATPDTPSTAPFESVDFGYLPLYGCVAGAEFYRVLAAFADSDGLTTPWTPGDPMTPLPASAFGAPTPVIAPQPWQVATISGVKSPAIVPDSDGWYPSGYLADYYPQNLLVNWAPANGVYQLTVETGTGAPGSVAKTGSSAAPVTVVVDNSPPTVTFQPAGWKYAASTGMFIPFPADGACFIIERSGNDIEIQLAYTVTAYHLYSISLVPDGCAVGTPGDITVADAGGLAADGTSLSYVYDGPFDNSLPDSSLTGTATYTIAGDAPDGCYSWTLTARSRAFNPNASQGLDDVSGSAWNYVEAPIYSDPSLSIAIVTS